MYDVPYIPIKFLEDMLNIQVNLASNRIAVIDYNKDAVIMGELMVNKGLKRDATIFSPYVTKPLKKEDKVRVFEQVGQWYKVRTADGIIGYLQGKYLNITGNYQGPPTQSLILSHLNLIWVNKYGM